MDKPVIGEKLEELTLIEPPFFLSSKFLRHHYQTSKKKKRQKQGVGSDDEDSDDEKLYLEEFAEDVMDNAFKPKRMLGMREYVDLLNEYITMPPSYGLTNMRIGAEASKDEIKKIIDPELASRPKKPEVKTIVQMLGHNAVKFTPEAELPPEQLENEDAQRTPQQAEQQEKQKPDIDAELAQYPELPKQTGYSTTYISDYPRKKKSNSAIENAKFGIGLYHYPLKVRDLPQCIEFHVLEREIISKLREEALIYQNMYRRLLESFHKFKKEYEGMQEEMKSFRRQTEDERTRFKRLLSEEKLKVREQKKEIDSLKISEESLTAEREELFNMVAQLENKVSAITTQNVKLQLELKAAYAKNNVEQHKQIIEETSEKGKAESAFFKNISEYYEQRSKELEKEIEEWKAKKQKDDETISKQSGTIKHLKAEVVTFKEKIGKLENEVEIIPRLEREIKKLGAKVQKMHGNALAQKASAASISSAKSSTVNLTMKSKSRAPTVVIESAHDGEQQQTQQEEGSVSSDEESIVSPFTPEDSFSKKPSPPKKSPPKASPPKVSPKKQIRSRVATATQDLGNSNEQYKKLVELQRALPPPFVYSDDVVQKVKADLGVENRASSSKVKKVFRESISQYQDVADFAKTRETKSAPANTKAMTPLPGLDSPSPIPIVMNQFPEAGQENEAPDTQQNNPFSDESTKPGRQQAQPGTTDQHPEANNTTSPEQQTSVKKKAVKFSEEEKDINLDELVHRRSKTADGNMELVNHQKYFFSGGFRKDLKKGAAGDRSKSTSPTKQQQVFTKQEYVSLPVIADKHAPKKKVSHFLVTLNRGENPSIKFNQKPQVPPKFAEAYSKRLTSLKGSEDVDVKSSLRESLRDSRTNPYARLGSPSPLQQLAIDTTDHGEG